MARANYKAAIYWLAHNDDNEWIEAPLVGGEILASVTACLVADLFGKTIDVVTNDLRRELRKMEREP
jgi:hypothetical protein